MEQKKTKLNGYFCEGQMSIFDFAPDESITTASGVAASENTEEIYELSWEPGYARRRYDGENTATLVKGKYYNCVYEISFQNDRYIISVNVDDEAAGLKVCLHYNSVPELMDNWFIPEMWEWIREVISKIWDANGVKGGISSLGDTPFCQREEGFLCNSHARDVFPYCRHAPGCCKFCPKNSTCGFDCKVPYEIDSTYELFRPKELCKEGLK